MLHQILRSPIAYFCTMAKVKTTYVCQSCGAQSPKWSGKCSSCGEWNTLVEELITKGDKPKAGDWNFAEERSTPKNRPTLLQEVSHQEEDRLSAADAELNRVLGGGIMPGSVVLISGEPGIGKSTLLLQVALGMGKARVLYVTGEESARQVKLRADRIGLASEECYLLTETATQHIFSHAATLTPDLLIIDSVQTLQSPYVESAAGSVSQIRECTAEFIKYAKETGTPVFLIGHVTKEGTIAGPKVLEHMVDTVLQFEGDRHLSYRILRTTKNRFGSTSEIGIYEMQAKGLRQVNNPSEVLISQRDDGLNGISIGTTLEGNRPLLIEVQALLGPAAYGTPQRSSTGFDAKRLNMLLAVLEKRIGYKIGPHDVFLNITGGIRIEDPAVDLAVCAAVLSSYEGIEVPRKACFAAEVGLGGELRAVNRIEQRISEAAKLGFEEIYISKYNEQASQAKAPIKVISSGKIDDIVVRLFR